MSDIGVTLFVVKCLLDSYHLDIFDMFGKIYDNLIVVVVAGPFFYQFDDFF